MHNNHQPTLPYISLQSLVISINDLTIKQANTGAQNKLRVKEMELLKILCQNYPEVTLRKELADTIWAGTYASDFTINQTVNGLRSKLFELGKTYIVTVPKRGYKLTIAPRYHDSESLAAAMPVKSPTPPLSPARPPALPLADTTPGNPESRIANAASLAHLKSIRFYLFSLCTSVALVALLHWLLPTDTAYKMGDTTVLFIPNDNEIKAIQRITEQDNYQYIDKVKETLYGCNEKLVCSKIKP
ncbi:winged helix-turn-helix domain-containing protein [Photobacterium sp. DA100]|uniref:winged helix-turn-helix domain-containing protein n=1 Tax=Photobacterium sp. DA100 TaxID=3027472 RepID=UPI0024787726|nr:winged helix-turn-helix domain-containing protein [Photobacterium sp. DA100]WEM43467.1 winged helix-turn-helix domain-containing protein [Photobacterium sp. DA100]